MTLDLIHDGDHGGDDFITSLIFLAYPEYFNLTGITTCAGNIDPAQSGRNALMAVTFAKGKAVPVHTGACQPYLIPYLFKDDAFGRDGLGGIAAEFSDPGEATTGAIDWLEKILQNAPRPLTICVTGPMTNIALLLNKNPSIKNKIKQLVVMGGGTNPAGNIRTYAEFNFYIDPDAADLVLTSNIPIVLHTLNTTQKVIYGQTWQSAVRSLTPSLLAGRLDRIMRITESLEIRTFGSEGSFFHDHQVAGWLAMPENYRTKPVRARVMCGPKTQEPGRLIIEDDDDSPIRIVTDIVSTDAFFDFLIEGLRRILKEY